jgi:hypothetical protein
MIRRGVRASPSHVALDESLRLIAPQDASWRLSLDAMRQRRWPNSGSHLKIVLSAEKDDVTMRRRSTRT